MIESAQEFHRLRTSELASEYLRAALEEAPPAVWREVIATMPDMREWVAHNKTVPLEILELLARDADAKVRWTVAGKRKLPAQLQLELAGDLDAGVRHQLACNAKVTKRVLELLVNDAEEFVQQCAVKRLQKGDYAKAR
jgi:hypothetical protein